MEKNIEKRMYICVKLSHVTVQQRLSEPCKSTILQFKKKGLLGPILAVLIALLCATRDCSQKS